MPRNFWRCFAAVWICGLAGRLPAQTNDAPDSPVLTDIHAIWSHRQQPLRIRAEAVIYYFDRSWSVAWGESLGSPLFLPIQQIPVDLRVGDRVVFDGVVNPAQVQWDWAQTKVTILERGVATTPVAITNLYTSKDAPRLVSVEGLLDQLLSADTLHSTFHFIGEDRGAWLNVLLASNNQALPFGAGEFIRAKCIYSPRFDENGELSQVDLWVAGPSDVQVIGSLANAPRFTGPILPIDDVQDDIALDRRVNVRGVVHAHDIGQWVDVWDQTGQIFVQSEQTLPVRTGDLVEASGFPYVMGVQRYLRRAMYRPIAATNAPSLNAAETKPAIPLRLAERVRELDRQTAELHLPVQLRAVVTWGNTNSNFLYVQDGSGGIQVMTPTGDSAQVMQPGAIVDVRGETAEGDFVPVITNATVAVRGFHRIDDVPLITLEQAMTGAYDGRLVQMRGLLRKSAVRGGIARWQMAASSGDFEVCARPNRAVRLTVGSIVRVQGVCAAVCNRRHQLTGITLWSAETDRTHVDEPAPDDPFAEPLRALADLRRFNLQTDLDRRVRTSGTVILHAPGRYLYIEDLQGGAGSDEVDSVLALSSQTNALQIGDKVEVTGFPGHQGRRFVLREAIYRKIGSGAEPAAKALGDGGIINPDLDGVLAKVDGRLLNAIQAGGEIRMLVETRDATVQGILESRAGDRERLDGLRAGSQLALTGIYEIQTDEYNQPRSMHLRLRGWDDIKVLAQPPWWTPGRMWAALLAVVCVSFVSVVWGVLISRKNLQLHQTKAALQAAHDKLETRVAERTRELREQIAEKERAHAELAETQVNLMTASRQAGMAEVATGVLHNVGNVLNSLNVSANVLQDRIQRLSVDSVAKIASLLEQNANSLDRFFTENPKGRLIPEFLRKLGQNLERSRGELAEETKIIARNIEHISTIISMQQNYARLGGVIEMVDPASIVEDAIAINGGSLKSHDIELSRDYKSVPQITVDRHKMLQILINLISNAKHALAESRGEKRLSISIAPGADRVRILVADNGIGIAKENLNRIFSQGFTTRKDGHGFGLHSGAIAAKELGGALTAQSDGLGQGATFALELPLTARTSGATARTDAPAVKVNAA